MKQFKLLSIVIALILVFAAFGPASAQLGTTDSSSIRIQNVSGGSVQVTVQFVASLAPNTTYTPNPLSNSPAIANPFTLANNASILIDVKNVPSLPAGSYSVVISSTGKVVATASTSGSGAMQFSGAYPSFGGGSTKAYLPNGAYNYYNWFSLISVMNVGSSPADVTVKMTCTNSGFTGLVGTLTTTNLAANASYTWALKNVIPAGFTAATKCAGGVEVSSTQPIVAVDNLNTPCCGQTNAYESINSGSPTVYVPLLSSNYYGWVSSLNIQKLGAGATTVNVVYGDGKPPSTCLLDDVTPSCMLFMPNPNAHPISGYFGAKITNTAGKDLLIAVGSSHTSKGYSGGYTGFSSGAPSVAAPMAFKWYFNWVTSINCMNISTTPTTLNVAYEGIAPYNTAVSLNQGASYQIYTGTDTHLPAYPASWAGSVVITANAVGAQIACLIDSSFNDTYVPLPTPGDWTLTYNAQPK